MLRSTLLTNKQKCVGRPSVLPTSQASKAFGWLLIHLPRSLSWLGFTGGADDTVTLHLSPEGRRLRSGPLLRHATTQVDLDTNLPVIKYTTLWRRRLEWLKRLKIAIC